MNQAYLHVDTKDKTCQRHESNNQADDEIENRLYDIVIDDDGPASGLE